MLNTSIEPEFDVKKDIKDEGPSAVLGKGDSSDHPNTLSETETLPMGQESSTEVESKSLIVEDKDSKL